jgi:hypothetical protein
LDLSGGGREGRREHKSSSAADQFQRHGLKSPYWNILPALVSLKSL